MCSGVLVGITGTRRGGEWAQGQKTPPPFDNMSCDPGIHLSNLGEIAASTAVHRD